MRVKVDQLAGLIPALMGMGMSHGLVGQRSTWYEPELIGKLFKRADILAGKDGGHNKFLESIILFTRIQAPRNWWQEMDTYRHLSKQSESTMHTIVKRPLTHADFMAPIYPSTLDNLNHDIKRYHKTQDAEGKAFYFDRIKNNLPEGFLQARMVRLDLMTLRNIYRQRKNHKLKAWQLFLEQISEQIDDRMWGWVTA